MEEQDMMTLDDDDDDFEFDTAVKVFLQQLYIYSIFFLFYCRLEVDMIMINFEQSWKQPKVDRNLQLHY